jgi:hypothetical protein
VLDGGLEKKGFAYNKEKLKDNVLHGGLKRKKFPYNKEKLKNIVLLGAEKKELPCNKPKRGR